MQRELIVVKINNDQRHELVSYLIELQEHDQDNKDLQSSIKMITELNVDTVDVPKFFKDAFESRELYPYLKDIDLLSFFKNNVLLPMCHKDSGFIQTSDELEHIIKGDKYSIESNVNKEIEMLIIKLAFFKSFKSMINPKLARTEDDLSRTSSSIRPSAPSQSLCSTRAPSPLIGAIGGVSSPRYLDFNDMDHSTKTYEIPNTPSPSLYLNSPISPIHSPEYSNFSDSLLQEESLETSSPPSSLEIIEAFKYDGSSSKIQSGSSKL